MEPLPPSVPPVSPASVPATAPLSVPSPGRTVGDVVVVAKAATAASARSSMRSGSAAMSSGQRASAPLPRALTSWRSSVGVAAGRAPRSVPSSSTWELSPAASQMRSMRARARASLTASVRPKKRYQ